MKTSLVKILSIFFGITLWYLFRQASYDTISVEIPVCFYNLSPSMNIKAPSTINITLAGTRKELQNLDLPQLALHLDATRFSKPRTYVAIESQHLFLPTAIKLVRYSPAPVLIELLLQTNQS